MPPTDARRAYEFILDAVLDGRWAPGDRVSPMAISRQIGISHIPVREAIGQLHAEGVLVQIPHRGAFVRRLLRREVLELVELRSVLECHAAAGAAVRIDQGQLDDLAKLVDVLEHLAVQIPTADRVEAMTAHLRWILVDRTFHMVVAHAAGNVEIAQTLQRIWLRTIALRAAYPDTWPDLRTFFSKNVNLHRDVYDAMRRHDSAAAQATMAIHMDCARQNLLGRFDWLTAAEQGDNPPVDDSPAAVRELVREIEERYFGKPSDQFGHLTVREIAKRAGLVFQT